MGGSVWRRLIAVLALIVGIGVASPAVHANADTTSGSATGSTSSASAAGLTQPSDDWWW